MDENQYYTVLACVALSVGAIPSSTVTVAATQSSYNREDAFHLLESFRTSPNVAQSCITLIGARSHIFEAVDVTGPTKLYALQCLHKFVKSSYSSLASTDASSLRDAVLRSIAEHGKVGHNGSDFVGSKMSGLLGELVLRDFPQRWTNFAEDFKGLWETSDGAARLCMEALAAVTEDCTDSDFNSKIATKRRNEVMKGFNEISSSHLLPQIFEFCSRQFNVLTTAKGTKNAMETHLSSAGRNPNQHEQQLYDDEKTKISIAGKMLETSLVMLNNFCLQMPLEWMSNTTYDFVSVFLLLMKEKSSSIQIHAISCLHSLGSRKIEHAVWFRLITSIPPAVAAAEQEAATDSLVMKLQFHRKLSKMLSHIVSGNIALITTDKEIMSCSGQKYKLMGQYFSLMTDMLQHPSGVICSEQVAMWTLLFRDPQIVKNKLIDPFIPALLAALLKHLVRIRWSDVEDGTHIQLDLIDASWDDNDEYDSWMTDMRSKSSLLFRFMGNSDPKHASAAIYRHIFELISNHGNGEPMDHIDSSTNRLTTSSEAVIKMEGVQLAMDNILQGIPSWALNSDGTPGERDNRIQIRSSVRSSLSQLASLIVSWKPNDVWLKLRHACMLQTVVYIWKYESTTLLQGVDILLSYLCAKDECSHTSLREDMRLSDDVTGLRRRSGLAVVSVGKRVPELLLPWLDELSARSLSILSTEKLFAPNQMHLYEFLSCVANAIDDSAKRSAFVSDVLSGSIGTLESNECTEAFSSVEGLMKALGIYQASGNPSFVNNPTSVKEVSDRFGRMFSAFNQLLSVGKRCSQAAKKRGLPMQNASSNAPMSLSLDSAFALPPDEGPLSINELALNNAFVPLWPRLISPLLQALDTVLKLCRPEYQVRFFLDPCQCYMYAISDDEAYLATKRKDACGGVFGPNGTAGSIVSGINRKQKNLLPRWSGWLSELRNGCLQLLGMMAEQRVLYSPEFSPYYPSLVQVLLNQESLRSMEHRHIAQLMKQFIEPMIITCPSPLYHSHVAPLLCPLFDHLNMRITSSWAPLVGNSPTKHIMKALTSEKCVSFARASTNISDEWFHAYYARGGLFVGDLDPVTSEAMTEKVRLEVTRVFADMLMSAFALKGEWALVLANICKEEQALKKNDLSLLNSVPGTQVCNDGETRVNADGTERIRNQTDVEFRQLARIKAMLKFLLLENETIAGPIVIFFINGLSYPDGYTCRRCIKLCHRVTETCAPDPAYTEILGKRMFEAAIKSIVLEAKWMVGIEWDMIALVRDIYCRLVLGQSLLPGAQGAGQQTGLEADGVTFVQSKNAANPLLGGGVLCLPSDIPREVLASLPGVSVDDVRALEKNLKENMSAKDQKDALRDLLRIAADNVKNAGLNLGGSQEKEESVLHQKTLQASIPDIPEQLIINSQVNKDASSPDIPLGGLDTLFGP